MSIAKVVNNRYMVDSLYQWDQNQTLSIYGLSLPSVPEIHFSNSAMNTAIVVQATVDAAGVVTVDIPQMFLESSGNIDVYVCIYEGDSFRCLYKLVVPVKARQKPSDYVYTETEILTYKTLDKRISQLEENDVSDERISAAISNYLEEHPLEVVDAVTSVNGVKPDENGNVEITIPDSGGNVDLTEQVNRAEAAATAAESAKQGAINAQSAAMGAIGHATTQANNAADSAIRAEEAATRAEEAAANAGNVDLTGVVKSVNGKTPDENGNVEIAVSGGGSGADYSFLSGLKYYAFGDSVVDMQGTLTAPETFGDTGYTSDLQSRNITDITVEGYVTAIERRYGLVATNFGKGGHTLVGDYSTLASMNYADVALVTLAYGVNDARTGVPLGTVNSTDVTTFAGAMNQLLRKIYTDNPECRVVILSPIQRLYVSDFGISTPNVNGNYLVDFVDMCKKVAAKRSTKCIDMYRECGINQTNLYYYTVEGVHPVNQGFARMRGAVIPVLDDMFAMGFEPFGTMTNTGDTEPEEPDTGGGTGGDEGGDDIPEDDNTTVVDLSSATVTESTWKYDNWGGMYTNQTGYSCIGPIELVGGKTYTLTAYVKPDVDVNQPYWGKTHVAQASAELSAGGATMLSRDSVDTGEVLSADGNAYKKATATFNVPTDETYYIFINRIDAIDLSNYKLTYI